MAKQVGPLFITGTIDGIIFYKLGEQYYIRSKGSYKSAKYMRRDPRLKRTMQKAAQFGQASDITKEVYYRHLPREIRKHGLLEEAKALLITHCQSLVPEGLVAPITPVTYVEEPSAARVEAAPAVVSTTRKSVRVSTQKTKKARYLSEWKVRRNGRLHISTSENRLPSIRPVFPSIALHPRE
jgi:hypothetical protein